MGNSTPCTGELQFWSVMRSQMAEQTKQLARIAAALESLVKDKARADEIRLDRRPDKAGEMKAADRPDAPETGVRAMLVLVVDDASSTAGYVKKLMPDARVVHYWRLPEDESVFSQFDALVIDGEGIGNKKWKHGLDFCKAYDKPEGQSVVFHSGLCAYGDDAAELERRGIANITKGGNPEKLVLSIRFPMAKQVGGAR